LCAAASASPISFVPTAGGTLGIASTTIGGVGVTGYYNNGAIWQAATLFGRNDDDDLGLGVISPGEHGWGSGTEVGNIIHPELIRLTLPQNSTWTSVQLSSLEGWGRVWADADGI